MIENLDGAGEVTNPLLSPEETSEPTPRRRVKSEAMPFRKLARLAKICAIIFVLTLVLIVVSALFAHRPVSQMLMTSFHSGSKLGLSHIVLDQSIRRITFANREETQGISGSIYLSISIPYTLKSRNDDPHNERCDFSQFRSSSNTTNHHMRLISEYQQSCFEFDNEIHAVIYETDVIRDLECYVVHWYSQNKNSSLENCIDISTDNWFGGGSSSIHHWPLNKANIPMQSFITKKFNSTLSHLTKGHFTSFLQPYFLSAQGIALLINDNSPLFISVNENDSKKICLRSAFDKPFDLAQSSFENGIHLNYTICKDYSARAIHQQLLELGVIQHPKQTPSLDILQKPVWSTRGQRVSDEVKLLSFVKSIKDSSLNFSQLFIDGNYTKSPGNFFFNDKTFPHSAQIVMELDEILPERKLKVATEVYPFVPDFGVDKNFSFHHMHYTSDVDPSLLDVFNEKANEWYISRLKDIQQQIHVSAFRFSGGEAANFLRNGSMKPLKLAKNFAFNEITTNYSYIASQFRDGSFVSSGYKCQSHGMIADAGPFLSSWNYRMGLKSVIPSVTTLGLIGYPFVSAGPIGGISQDKHDGHFTLPSEDLYIRWLQLSIFLPVVEFSVGPWEYGSKVVKYAKELLEYRKNVLWPQHLASAVKESVDIGTPIIRPLWWIAPDDVTAQAIDSEFLVSNSLLVAPVVAENQQARDVYLPEGGWWQDLLHGRLYKGGDWYHIPVGQFEIATFIHKAPPKSKS